MTKKSLFTGVAVAALLGAVPAMAQQNLVEPAVVTINVAVQEIAQIVTVTSSGLMTIANATDSTMGFSLSTDSTASPNNYWATMRLNTNFDIDRVSVSYPNVTNIRNWSDSVGDDTVVHTNPTWQWFGAATCTTPGTCGTNTLGVSPKVATLPFVSTTSFGPNTTGQSSATHNTVPGTSQISHCRDNGSASPPCAGTRAFTPGSHLLAIGVSGKWNNTVAGPTPEPLFALPGTYTIDFTATIVPAVSMPST